SSFLLRLTLPPPSSTLFPYTTLFRSGLNPVHADANDSWRRRVLVLTIVAMAGFAGLLGQLWYLQTLEGGRLQEMSDKNRIRIRRSEEHTSELQSLTNIVCRLLLGKKN